MSPSPSPPVRAALEGFAWTAASGVAIGLLLAFGAGKTAARELFVYCVVATIYAVAIGVPASALLPRVSRPIEGRRLATRVAGIGVALAAVCTAGSLAAGLLLVALRLVAPSAFWSQFFGGLRIALVVGVILTAGAYFSASLRRRAEEARQLARASEDERRRAEKLADEARLAALASRIHPHFLFNTLNTIAALIPEEPARAEAVVNRLAALLRAALDRGRAALVPLAEERRLVEDYLDIQRTRFGDRLRAVIDVPDELSHAYVPPFCLQTLVENAVVHGASTRTAPTTVEVVARREAGRLLLLVSDDGPGFSAAHVPEGRGIATLRERLEALFGADARLEIRPSEIGACLVVSLPCASPEAAA